MDEFIKKLIGGLEDEHERCINRYGVLGGNLPAMEVKQCIEIVNQFAEEYKGGWIPCSERLPENDSICIVTVEYPNNEIVVDYGWWDRKGVCWYVGMQEFRTSNILAWQPLPAPYKECEKQ